MVEHSLLRSLLTKKFYDDTRGNLCPANLFNKDLRKIKETIDISMDSYERDLTLEELKSLFFVKNPTLTTSQKHQYEIHFNKIRDASLLGVDVAKDILSKLFQQYVGEKVANIGFQFVNNEVSSLEPLRQILEEYKDDFTPETKVKFVDSSVDHLVAAASASNKYRFNIHTLYQAVSGLDSGMLFVIGARSNVGKSSFHATLCASPNGWASQGAKILVLCNEEKPERVASRYMTCATGMTMNQIQQKKEHAIDVFGKIRDNIKFVDATGKTMVWVEGGIKAHRPDIVVLDIGSKFAEEGASTNSHEALKANAIHARNLGKLYGCLVVYSTQLSAEAEGKIVLSQAMIEGSRTGLAGESDLMILIARNPPMNDQTEDDGMRYLNIVKNKISGVHRIVNCEFDYTTGEYTS